MSDAEAGEPDLEQLRSRALDLRELGSQAKVMAGTMAERDLERGRAELEKALQAIERGDRPLWAIADRLRGIAITLESALYMGGINTAGSPPVIELQVRLAAWFERG